MNVSSNQLNFQRMSGHKSFFFFFFLPICCIVALNSWSWAGSELIVRNSVIWAVTPASQGLTYQKTGNQQPRARNWTHILCCPNWWYNCLTKCFLTVGFGSSWALVLSYFFYLVTILDIYISENKISIDLWTALNTTVLQKLAWNFPNTEVLSLDLAIDKALPHCS